MRSGHDMKGVYEGEGAWDLMTDVSSGMLPEVNKKAVKSTAGFRLN